MWKGYYKYEGQSEKIDTVWESVKMKDDYIKGEGVDAELGNYTIEGTLDGRNIEFAKNYADDKVVKYSGQVSKDKTRMWGHWDINEGEELGSFKVKAIEDKSKPKFKNEDGDVFWLRKGEWTLIGDDVKQMQFYLKHVWIVKRSDNSMWKWNYGEADSWEQVGSDVHYIMCDEFLLLMKSKKHQNIWRWNWDSSKWDYHPMRIYK